MNVLELRQMIHDLPDDCDVQFALDGEVYDINGKLHVNEWNTLYFGIDDEDLKDSMIEWSLENDDDEDGPNYHEDDEEYVDRSAFEQQLEAAEATEPTWEGLDKDCKPVGECCTIPPVRKEMWDRKKDSTGSSTEMM